VRQDVAEPNGLETLEDLAAYINSGGEFKIAGSDEFFSSEAAMPSFEEGYGFQLSDTQIVTLSGGNTALTESAAADGIDGVNAAMAYGTDGQLAAFNLVVMTDTKGIQPVYEPAPIIREEVLLAYPEIEGILAPVFASLDLVTLQTLNGRIAVEGEDARSVAQDYLTSKGFLP
jgi:osmoprotectant transport system substrate-binding protein